MVCLRVIISVGEQGWVAAHSKIRATHNHNHPHVPSQPVGISPVIALTLFSHGNTTSCQYFSWNCSEFLFICIKAPTNTHMHPITDLFSSCYLHIYLHVHSDLHLQLLNTTLFLDCHYSMIIWNCQKVYSSNSALKPSQCFPMCQKLRICGTFWYFRHLGPTDQLENINRPICDLRQLKKIGGKSPK